MLWLSDTLVLKEHLFAHAQERLPHLTWTRTLNAEENTPMIRINKAMGYEIAGFNEFYVKDAAVTS